jgi:hypothetical protein
VSSSPISKIFFLQQFNQLCRGILKRLI